MNGPFYYAGSALIYTCASVSRPRILFYFVFCFLLLTLPCILSSNYPYLHEVNPRFLSGFHVSLLHQATETGVYMEIFRC